jgi:hypothetical protein
MFESIIGPIIGAAAGSLFGGSDSGGTQTQKTELPNYLKPYGDPYAKTGAELASMPYQPYPYQRVAPFTQDQLYGMDMARQQAGYYSPLWSQAQNQLSNTLGGQYMDPASNPYLQQTYDIAANRMADAYSRGTGATTNAIFGKSGSFGGSAHQEVTEGNNRAFGDSLGGLANQLFGGNYQAERARQLGAMQYAPQFAGQQQNYGLTNINALLGIGQMMQGQGQQYMDADYAQFQDAMNYPYRQFDTFRSLFNTNLGGTQSTTFPGISPLQGAASGGLLGLALNRYLQPQQQYSGYPTAGNLAGTSMVYSPQYGYVPHL